MADDITVDRLPYVYEVGAAEKVIALNPTRLYTIHHTGKDSAGAASIGDVFANMQDAAVTTTYASAAGKLILQSGGSYPVPPGTERIRMKTSAGNVTLQFIGSEVQHGLA